MKRKLLSLFEKSSAIVTCLYSLTTERIFAIIIVWCCMCVCFKNIHLPGFKSGLFQAETGTYPKETRGTVPSPSVNTTPICVCLLFIHVCFSFMFVCLPADVFISEFLTELSITIGTQVQFSLVSTL